MSTNHSIAKSTPTTSSLISGIKTLLGHPKESPYFHTEAKLEKLECKQEKETEKQNKKNMELYRNTGSGTREYGFATSNMSSDLSRKISVSRHSTTHAGQANQTEPHKIMLKRSDAIAGNARLSGVARRDTPATDR